MVKESTQPARITEELETLSEAYERQRVESMTPLQQHIYLTHLEDQFEAIPPYVERFKHNQSSGRTG